MTPSLSSRFKNTAKGACLFVAVGPPVGSYVLLLIWLLSSIGDPSWSWSAAKDVGVLLIVFPVFSYILGGIPALLAGIITGWWRHTLIHTWGMSISACVSAMSGLGFLVLLLDDNIEASFLAATAVASLLAGLSCAWIFRPRPENAPPSKRFE